MPSPISPDAIAKAPLRERSHVAKILITLAALWPIAGFAQAPIPTSGNLTLQRLLGEIAALGPTAQATARGNLGVSGSLVVPVAPFLVGGSGSILAGTFGAGLQNNSNTISVLYGTSAGTALQGSMLGAAGGVAALDSSGGILLVA